MQILCRNFWLSIIKLTRLWICGDRILRSGYDWPTLLERAFHTGSH